METCCSNTIRRRVLSLRIKAQYIIYLAAGLVILLLVFAILYVLGISIYICLGIVIPAGAGLFMGVQHYSKKYGEHGLMKKTAQKRLPAYVKSTTRKVFTRLSEKNEKSEAPGTNNPHLQN